MAEAVDAADIAFLVDQPANDASNGILEEETKASLRLDSGSGPAGGTLHVIASDDGRALVSIPVQPGSLWRSPHGNVYLLQGAADERDGSQPTYVLRPRSPAAAAAMDALYAKLPGSTGGTAAKEGRGAATVAATTAAAATHFDRKTDRGSAELYFHYYGMLMHQQNMMQDYIRTGTYYSAITENAGDFAGKAVMDVGCGSGILSLFAVQAGARVVYAVEASNMARFARQLADANPAWGARIEVLHSKVEEVEIPEKVDILVSEPMGTLLVNERMIETYLYARDKHLRPGGKMFPRLGRIHVAAFSDVALHAEISSKADFWAQPNFYGVDLACLHRPAAAGYFSQVVVDQIPPNALVSNCASKSFDFGACSEAELYDVTVPLSLQVAAPCTVHGIAAWFDVLFDGTSVQRFLSTAPGLPVTHWFQLRCVLQNPLVVARPGETVSGTLRLVAHARQSYDVLLTLRAPAAVPGGQPQESSGTFDLKEPYYRQLVAPVTWYPAGADAGGGAGTAGPPPAQHVEGLPLRVADPPAPAASGGYY